MIIESFLPNINDKLNISDSIDYFFQLSVMFNFHLYFLQVGKENVS